MSAPVKISDERLLEVLYHICNYSDHTGPAIFKVMRQYHTDITEEECKESLFRLWQVIRENQQANT